MGLLRRILFGERRFSLSVESAAPAKTIIELLADPKRWIRFHPLIDHIEAEPGSKDTYVITEHLDMGFKLKNVYRARITPVSDGIECEAWAAAGTHLSTRYSCADISGGTRIDETAVVTAPRMLVGYTARTAQKAHAAMLERLARAASE